MDPTAASNPSALSRRQLLELWKAQKQRPQPRTQQRTAAAHGAAGSATAGRSQSVTARRRPACLAAVCAHSLSPHHRSFPLLSPSCRRSVEPPPPARPGLVPAPAPAAPASRPALVSVVNRAAFPRDGAQKPRAPPPARREGPSKATAAVVGARRRARDGGVDGGGSDGTGLAETIAWTKPRAAKKQRTAADDGAQGTAAAVDALAETRARLQAYVERAPPTADSGPLTPPTAAFVAALTAATALLRARDFGASLSQLRSMAAEFPEHSACSAYWVFRAYAEEHQREHGGEVVSDADADARACAAFRSAVDGGARPASEVAEAFASFERRRVNRLLLAAGEKERSDRRSPQSAQHHTVQSSERQTEAPLSSTAALAFAAPPSAALPASRTAIPGTPLSALLQRYKARQSALADPGLGISAGRPRSAIADCAPPATPRSAALRARWTEEGGRVERCETDTAAAAAPTPRSARLCGLRLTPEAVNASQPHAAGIGEEDAARPPTGTAEPSHSLGTPRAAGDVPTGAEAAEPSTPELARNLMDDWPLSAEKDRAAASEAADAAVGTQSPLPPLPPLTLAPHSPQAEPELELDVSAASSVLSSSPTSASSFDEDERVADLTSPHAEAQSQAAAPSPSLRSLLSVSERGVAQRHSAATATATATAAAAADGLSAAAFDPLTSPSSVVVLQRVRAGPSLRQTLGSDFFLSPVRRSSRRPSAALGVVVEGSSDAQRRSALEQTDYAFLPNQAVQPPRARAQQQQRKQQRQQQQQQQSTSTSPLLDAAAVGAPSPSLHGVTPRSAGRRERTPTQRRPSSSAQLSPPPLLHPNVIVLQPVRSPASSSSQSPFASPVRRSARHARDWAERERETRARLSAGEMELASNRALGNREQEWKARSRQQQHQQQRDASDRERMPPPPPRRPRLTAASQSQDVVVEVAAPAGRFEGGRRHCTPRPTHTRRRSTISAQEQEQEHDANESGA